MLARRHWLVLLLLLGPLVTSHDAYADGPAGDIDLLSGFSAKEACSCVFVVGQTDAYCTAFGQQPGYALTVTIDRTASTVTSVLPPIGTPRTARATWTGGCTLDGL